MDRRIGLLLAAAQLALAISVSCSTANVGAPSLGGGTSGGGSGSGSLTAPTPDTPSDDEQLTTLRPTLTVRNGTSTATGARTYEFQIADNNGFSPVAVTRTGVAEDATGRTSFTPDSDLQSSTRFYWRARLVQGSNNSAWSTTVRFRTRLAGYNRPGELYDPLASGDTVGNMFGATTFVTGKGLRIDSEASFVRYQLPQTMAAGEFSMEVEGLRANGPGQKLKVFSMMDGTGDLIASRFQLSAQYRGVNGNPDNCISYKAVWGAVGVNLEPDLGQRTASVQALDPARTYFWQGNWNSTSFRLVIRADGPTGTVIYDRTSIAPSGTGPYAPTPHFAYLGANSAVFNTETGSWPGVIYRNVWLSDKPRPTSLGSALRVER